MSGNETQVQPHALDVVFVSAGLVHGPGPKSREAAPALSLRQERVGPTDARGSRSLLCDVGNKPEVAGLHRNGDVAGHGGRD
jgi:hypothetical protein